MRARTHEQEERKNQLLFYCSKEDITEMLIDAETIIDALNYKIKILEEENKEQRERIDKAIEYASKNPHPEWEQVVPDVLVSGKTILNILRSED